MVAILNALKSFYSIAVFQALLITVFLFIQKKGNAGSRKLLAILLIDFIIFLSGTFLLLFYRYFQLRYFAHLTSLAIFLVAPLLYFYYKSLVNPKFPFSYRMLLHAIPFFVIFSVMTYEMVIQANHKFFFRPYGIVLLTALFLQNIIYFIFILKQKEGLLIKKSDNKKAKWFRSLFLSVFFIFGFKLIIFIVWNIFGFVDACIFLTGLFFVISFIIVNLLVIYGLLNPEVLSHLEKYQSTPIDKFKSDSYYDDLLRLFSEKDLFKDSLLNLGKLAKMLNVPEKHLSQIINQKAGLNFNDFVNCYRIKEAQTLLSNDTRLNVIDVAYEVGFNSKSTFNTAFKKITGVTPSEFRKSSS